MNFGMKNNMRIIITALALLLTVQCNSQTQAPANVPAAQPVVKSTPASRQNRIICGAERTKDVLTLLQGKKVALLVNQTATVGKVHLVDTLLSAGIDIVKVLAPEHGFRGGADAGEHVNDSTDAKTGISIASMYGDKKKPSAKDLEGIDVVVFDIQDVGVRFFTYISSLHYLMEACAENGKEVVVLDRPNPNGWYVDGPVLQPAFKSFIGMDPVPIVHGLTVGEYAQMLNGEKWLANGVQCRLKVVTCLNYDHTKRYSLPVKPSPNLPTDYAIQLYPAVCLLEGTNISVGRGTDKPFQMIGGPKVMNAPDVFTPKSMPGAKTPPFLNEKCYGFDLTNYDNHIKGDNGDTSFTFKYIMLMYTLYTDKQNFFLKNNFFDKLVGNDTIKKLIIAEKNYDDIKSSYAAELTAYKKKRKAYLLYLDFE